jgi:hypothetical protein
MAEPRKINRRDPMWKEARAAIKTELGSGYESFDRLCDVWEAEHPNETAPYGELFAQWLADETGQAVIGGPAGEAPSVVAIPERS